MIGKTISHFKVLEQVGIGGMGVVYKARDLALDRIIALKSLHPGVSAGTKALGRLLIEEARTAAILDHPNICTIYEVLQTDDEQVFVAMAWYSGETVYQKLQNGPLPRPQAVAIASDVASGLGKAHRHGIIHQDIKPGNVMVTSDGVVKILDFGLAKLVSAAAARGGTLAYMSPEQVRGEQASEQSDVWSWGILLLEMLTGRRPFPHTRRADIILAITEGPLGLIDSLDSPPELLRVLRRALERNPSERYSQITEARQDLDRCFPPGSSIPVTREHDFLRAPKVPPLTRRFTTNQEANNLYLKARYQWNRGSPESLLKARNNLTQAIQHDPDFVPAFCALAECHLVMGARALVPPNDSWAKARDAATRALVLDADAAAAHGCLGAVLAIGEFNWIGAEREFQRGLALDPESALTRHWYAIGLLTPMGRFGEAVAEAGRAVEAEPLSLIYNSTLSWIYYLSRQWDLAAKQAERTLEIDPVHVDSLWCLATSHRQLGRNEESMETLGKLDQVSGGIPLVMASFGHYHARMGNVAEAERMLAAMRKPNPSIYCSPVCESWVHANLPGHEDAALDCLDRAWADRDFMVRYIHFSTALEPVYGSPRFDALLRKMALGPYAPEASTSGDATFVVSDSQRSPVPVQGDAKRG
jgi:serine/threonine protein kinase